ncbi:MAG: sirohydrochlorin cobaltochelatase [Eubacteriales bacterium]|nr:sirohydrochlorin cobaltochelatase [Eubacteriales bacterium]
MKKAILAVSFGTSHPDTLEKTIAAIEGALALAFPDRTLRRAFTSGMIRMKLKQRSGVNVDSVDSALDRLAREGFGDVVVQPTHIINGDEFDKLRALAAPFAGKFSRLALGAPLLTEADDYRAVAEALDEILPAPRQDAAVVLMGHGTGHHANAAYGLLQYVLYDRGRRDAVIGTVEGYPGLEEVLRRLEERKVRRVHLVPLMIVAGDHAKNDMAGEDPDSWRSRLEQLGYTVTWSLRGLGEYEAIQNIFVRHALAAEA